MPGGFRYEGYAIVSADGMIADADGRMPPALQNPADAALPQRGARPRRGAGPRPSFARGPSQFAAPAPRRPQPPRRGDRRRSASAAFGAVEPGWRVVRRRLRGARNRRRHGGDPRRTRKSTRCFSSSATSAFCSAAPPSSTLPGGLPIFGRGRLPVDEALAAAGLTPAEPRWLDREAGVSLTVWRKPAD